MKIYGLTTNEATAIARYIGCDWQATGEQETRNGPRVWGRPVPGPGERTPSGRLRKGGEPRYQRFSAIRVNPYSGDVRGGKRLNALCFHGLRDFIRQCFEFGATRVQSVAGRWDSLAEFENDLPRLAHNNLNTPGGSYYLGNDEWIERCDCVEREQRERMSA